jgi:hypothetical protein
MVRHRLHPSSNVQVATDSLSSRRCRRLPSAEILIALSFSRDLNKTFITRFKVEKLGAQLGPIHPRILAEATCTRRKVLILVRRFEGEDRNLPKGLPFNFPSLPTLRYLILELWSPTDKHCAQRTRPFLQGVKPAGIRRSGYHDAFHVAHGHAEYVPTSYIPPSTYTN